MHWRKLLYPFSLPYRLITGIRNWAFNNSILPSHKFDVPVICIGNLSTGGTGKTPMVEFLIENLTGYKIGFVSRGYGRKTKGLRWVNKDSSATEVGDEPLQIIQKHSKLTAAVSEKRTEGITAVIEKSYPDLILLDDAFQHRYVKPHFSILLTTYNEPYYRDHLLPAGNLREAQSGRKRADMIVVTKCPANLNDKGRKDIKTRLRLSENQRVFFSSLSYDVVHKNEKDQLKDGEISVVTGIANPAPMLAHLAESFTVTSHLAFRDHHNFTDTDLRKITASKNPVVTTEKDWTRLKSLLTADELTNIYYLPIKVDILFDEKEAFLREVKSAIKS